MTLSKSILRIILATAFLLLIPLVAMQFTHEVVWTLSDFVVAGALLFGTGLTYILVARKWNNTTYRMGVGVAVAAGLLLVWANLAVGLVGSEDNPVNLLYGLVLAVGIIGAVVARFRPLGMSNAMFAASLTYVIVTVIALFVWTPSGAVAEPSVGLANVIGANAAFAAIWAASGLLFRRASAAGSNMGQRLA
ncbi:hypothetical protein [Hymenobacter jejuensis]|uniref:Uncharacterized protein n=1 Tax=Hymenobacter jejuensis TaxID=2502781 RepID=A0A5B7ZWL8_9BACT|nr:hypothetical protein [Hymenobacter jejuensis]QDA59541.1 hypothetical protein FHG12_05210 [Hymenobacter jejuensis]